MSATASRAASAGGDRPAAAPSPSETTSTGLRPPPGRRGPSRGGGEHRSSTCRRAACPSRHRPQWGGGGDTMRAEALRCCVACRAVGITGRSDDHGRQAGFTRRRSESTHSRPRAVHGLKPRQKTRGNHRRDPQPRPACVRAYVGDGVKHRAGAMRNGGRCRHAHAERRPTSGPRHRRTAVLVNDRPRGSGRRGGHSSQAAAEGRCANTLNIAALRPTPASHRSDATGRSCNPARARFHSTNGTDCLVRPRSLLAGSGGGPSLSVLRRAAPVDHHPEPSAGAARCRRRAAQNVRVERLHSQPPRPPNLHLHLEPRPGGGAPRRDAAEKLLSVAGPRFDTMLALEVRRHGPPLSAGPVQPASSSQAKPSRLYGGGCRACPPPPLAEGCRPSRAGIPRPHPTTHGAWTPSRLRRENVLGIFSRMLRSTLPCSDAFRDGPTIFSTCMLPSAFVTRRGEA